MTLIKFRAVVCTSVNKTHLLFDQVHSAEPDGSDLSGTFKSGLRSCRQTFRARTRSPMAPKTCRPRLIAALTALFVAHLSSATLAQDGTDWVTKFPRDPIHVAAWPGGKKVAVSFTLFVEEFGFGQGPVFRPDLATRNPDLVNEAFRQYAIDWGIARVGRLFKELDIPLSVVLNAEFPGTHASVWKEFRAAQPSAPIIAHGMNNTSHMLPLGRGLAEQRAY